MQTVEAGWIQYPDQNAEPHLFTFFTVNDYTAWGDNLSGWNQDVLLVGSNTIVPISRARYSNQIVWMAARSMICCSSIIYTEATGGFCVSATGSATIPLHFSAPPDHPNQAGSTLSAGSDVIFFYGEVYQNEGPLTTTDMGRWEFANTGNTHAAYISNINYLDTSSTAQSYNVGWSADDSSLYSVDGHPACGTNWASYSYLGGSGAGGVVGG
jgi:hypothetical protein